MKSEQEREAWLAERKNHVTASDVAAVMGLNPNKTRKVVFRDKVYAGAAKDIDRLPMVMAGKHLESGILSWHLAHRGFDGYGWEAGDARIDQLGEARCSRITGSGLVRHPTSRVLAATPDAIVWSVEGGLRVTEIKNVGQDKALTDWTQEFKRGEWSNIPDACVLHAMPYQKINKDALRAPIYYWAQLQAQMSCLGIPQGRIVVAFGGNARADLDFRLHVGFETAMLDELDRFWKEVLNTRELNE